MLTTVTIEPGDLGDTAGKNTEVLADGVQQHTGTVESAAAHKSIMSLRDGSFHPRKTSTQMKDAGTVESSVAHKSVMSLTDGSFHPKKTSTQIKDAGTVESAAARKSVMSLTDGSFHPRKTSTQMKDTGVESAASHKSVMSLTDGSFHPKKTSTQMKDADTVESAVAHKSVMGTTDGSSHPSTQLKDTDTVEGAVACKSLASTTDGSFHPRKTSTETKTVSAQNDVVLKPSSRRQISKIHPVLHVSDSESTSEDEMLTTLLGNRDQPDLFQGLSQLTQSRSLAARAAADAAKKSALAGKQPAKPRRKRKTKPTDVDGTASGEDDAKGKSRRLVRKNVTYVPLRTSPRKSTGETTAGPAKTNPTPRRKPQSRDKQEETVLDPYIYDEFSEPENSPPRIVSAVKKTKKSTAQALSKTASSETLKDGPQKAATDETPGSAKRTVKKSSLKEFSLVIRKEPSPPQGQSQWFVPSEVGSELMRRSRLRSRDSLACSRSRDSSRESLAPSRSRDPSRESLARSGRSRHPSRESPARSRSRDPSRESLAPSRSRDPSRESLAPSRRSRHPSRESPARSRSRDPSRESLAPSRSRDPSRESPAPKEVSLAIQKEPSHPQGQGQWFVPSEVSSMLMRRSRLRSREKATPSRSRDPSRESLAPSRSRDPSRESLARSGRSRDPSRESLAPSRRSRDPSRESLAPSRRSRDPSRESSAPSGSKDGNTHQARSSQETTLLSRSGRRGSKKSAASTSRTRASKETVEGSDDDLPPASPGMDDGPSMALGLEDSAGSQRGVSALNQEEEEDDDDAGSRVLDHSKQPARRKRHSPLVLKPRRKKKKPTVAEIRGVEDGDHFWSDEEQEERNELEVTYNAEGRMYRRLKVQPSKSHTPGVRRSKRTRIAPVKTWENEQVEYDMRRRSGSHHFRCSGCLTLRSLIPRPHGNEVTLSSSGIKQGRQKHLSLWCYASM